MRHGLFQLGAKGIVCDLTGLVTPDHLSELFRLSDERVARRRRFLDHRRVLLGDLVHLVDGGVDLLQAGGLFLGAGGDLGDDGVDLGHLGDDPLQRLAGLPTSATPCSTCAVDAEISALISLAASAERWASARTSEATTAKPRPASPARAASTPAFSASRLVWKAISSITPMIWLICFEDFSIPAIAADRLAHHHAALVGVDLGGRDHVARVLGAFGGLLHRRGDLVERGGGLFQARGLLLGAPREVVGGRGDFAGPRADGLCAAGDRHHRVLQRLDRRVEVDAELIERGDEIHVDSLFKSPSAKRLSPVAICIDRVDAPVTSVANLTTFTTRLLRSKIGL